MCTVVLWTKVVIEFMFLYGADSSDKETQTASNNCAKLFLFPAANIVFLILLIFLFFQILFRIHLVSVVKCVARHVRLNKLGQFIDVH